MNLPPWLCTEAAWSIEKKPGIRLGMFVPKFSSIYDQLYDFGYMTLPVAASFLVCESDACITTLFWNVNAIAYGRVPDTAAYTGPVSSPFLLASFHCW